MKPAKNLSKRRPPERAAGGKPFHREHIPDRRHRRFRRRTRGARAVLQARAARKLHGFRRRPAPGPDAQGHAGGAARRASPLPVVQVTDGCGCEPGHVYVIPPNKDMSIVHGVCTCSRPVAPRGLRLPIDFFLRSLGRRPPGAQHRRASLGHGLGRHARPAAIREKAGAGFVQAPASAKFDGMPRSAIDAGTGRRGRAGARSCRRKISEYLQHARRFAAPERSAAGRQGAERAREDRRPPARLRPGTTSPSTRAAPSTAGSSGAWDCTRSTTSRTTSGTCARTPGGRAAVQGAPHRGDELLPRSGRVGAARERSAARSSWRRAPKDAVAARLGTRLLDRRGGLLARHRLQGGARALQARQEGPASDLRHGPRPRRHREGAAGALPRQHHRGRLAGAAAAFLRPRRTRLPRNQGDPRPGGLRAAERGAWIRRSPSSTCSRAATCSSTSRRSCSGSSCRCFTTR